MVIPAGDNGESSMRWCLATTPPPAPPLPFESGSSSKRRAARRGVGAEVVYRCLPCGMTNICLACARSCHGGHAVEVLFKGRSSVTAATATAAAASSATISSKAAATASATAAAAATGPACGCSAVPATCECRWTPVAGKKKPAVVEMVHSFDSSACVHARTLHHFKALTHSRALQSLRHTATTTMSTQHNRDVCSNGSTRGWLHRR
jgi:Putative zinc finger in N-recognin (UBR box)